MARPSGVFHTAIDGAALFLPQYLQRADGRTRFFFYYGFAIHGTTTSARPRGSRPDWLRPKALGHPSGMRRALGSPVWSQRNEPRNTRIEIN